MVSTSSISINQTDLVVQVKLQTEIYPVFFFIVDTVITNLINIRFYPLRTRSPVEETW